ncbi:hypothetical protein ACROYT_G020644 [Oculina patagonica]
MNACCSFKSLVGGQCSFDCRDRKQSTEIVPLLSCTKNVAQHKSLFQFHDVESEIELILARAAMFNTPQNVEVMTVCPSHRSSLGLGWTRGTERCRVPQDLSLHKMVRGKYPKAERGVNKTFSKLILKRTGHLVPVGSGMCRSCREILSSASEEEKLSKLASLAAKNSPPLVDIDNKEEEVVSQMKELTFREISTVTDQSHFTSTPFTEARSSMFSQADTPFGSLYLPSDTESLDDTCQDRTPVDRSRSALNNFLASRDISPIRSSLRTPWDDVGERTKRYYVKKASEAVAASLEVIAGKDSDKLWDKLVSSKAMNQHFPSTSLETEKVDSVLLESLAECYNSATQWDTRRQILSIMVDKVSFKSLQRWIPNLTQYRFKIARQHLLIHGRGSPVPKPIQKRMYVSPEMVDHFICFITSQHIIQDLPFGQKNLTLSSGEVIAVPNVIRTMIPERIAQQYQEYCKESGITCLSRSSLLRILDVCSASVRKSLQGLDYITASGAKAFEELEIVAERLGELGMGMSWAKQRKEQLKLAKRYLKSDFTVHVSESSTVPDHCRCFALSDAKCSEYQGECSHIHDGVCDRCSLVEVSIGEIEDALKLIATESEEMDELTFNTEQARRSISAWKAHLLRAVNQDEARVDVMEMLEENSVFLVQDWAMKFLPRKYRESQSDWFAKRGIPWHITVALRQRPNRQIETMAFVHIF